jgi:hypothetical protein
MNDVKLFGFVTESHFLEQRDRRIAIRLPA